MKVIDDYIKNENLKLNWFDKLVMNYPIVKPTKTLADSLENLQYGKEKVIKPSILDKAITLLVFAFVSSFWIGLLKMLLEYRFPFLVILIGFCFVTFIIYLLLRNAFFNKKYIYTIIIDHDGIGIDNNRHHWTDIEETCIAVREGGRVSNSWLLLFRKDKSVIKLELLKFGIPDNKLSTIIEYYKAKSQSIETHLQ